MSRQQRWEEQCQTLTNCGKNVADEGHMISRAAEMAREAPETHALWKKNGHERQGDKKISRIGKEVSKTHDL
jgi:hypothetical protein